MNIKTETKNGDAIIEAIMAWDAPVEVAISVELPAPPEAAPHVHLDPFNLTNPVYQSRVHSSHDYQPYRYEPYRYKPLAR